MMLCLFNVSVILHFNQKIYVPVILICLSYDIHTLLLFFSCNYYASQNETKTKISNVYCYACFCVYYTSISSYLLFNCYDNLLVVWYSYACIVSVTQLLCLSKRDEDKGEYCILLCLFYAYVKLPFHNNCYVTALGVYLSYNILLLLFYVT